MVRGLVPASRGLAVAVVLSLLSAFYLLFHNCVYGALPPDVSVEDGGLSCTLLTSVFFFRGSKDVRLPGLNFTLRPSTNYRRDLDPQPGSSATLPGAGAVTHLSSPPAAVLTTNRKFPHLPPPFPIRSPAKPEPQILGRNPLSLAANPAGHIPPGKNKAQSDPPPDNKGQDKKDPGPPPPAGETANTVVTTALATTSSTQAESTPVVTETNTPPPDPPTTFSSPAPTAANTNTKSADAEPEAQTTSATPPALQTGGTTTSPPVPAETNNSGSSVVPGASITSTQGSSPSSTATPSSETPGLSPLLDSTSTTPGPAYTSLASQSSPEATTTPNSNNASSSGIPSSDIRHSSKLAIILAVLFSLIALAAFVLMFILIRRRLRARRERDVEERNSFSPVLAIGDPFASDHEVDQVRHSDMLNMFRVSGGARDTLDRSTLSTWPGENNATGEDHRNLPNANEALAGQDADTPLEAEKAEHAELRDSRLRDSRYSESDSSWIWYRPPMAI